MSGGLAGDLASALDPVAFASSLGFAPEPWQQRLLRTPAPRVLLSAARQVGKSTTLAIRALHVAVYQPGALVLVFAPSQRQSDENLAKIRALYRRLGASKTLRDNGSELRLENDSRIISLPGSESSTRGFSAAQLLILDEAARASDDLLASALPMVATGGQMVVASTPWGCQGFFWQLHQDAGNGWERSRITCYDSAQYNAARIAEARATFPRHTFAADYECTFTDTDASVFSTELVRSAFTDSVVPLEVSL